MCGLKSIWGGAPSFIVAWCYWVNNFFFYPAVLTFFATTFTYAFGRPDLAKDTTFVTATVIIAFWIITFLTLFGVKMGKIVGSLGQASYNGLSMSSRFTDSNLAKLTASLLIVFLIKNIKESG